MNLLERYSSIHFGESTNFVSLTSTQVSMDAMQQGFVDQASDPGMLAAMVGGGLAYRFTRMAGFSAAASLGQGSGAALPFLLRASSYATALTTESLTFTSIQRAFHPSSGRSFGEEWLHTGISLGALKFFAHLGRGQNLILQHLGIDTGMVLSHQVAAWAQLENPSNESWVAQFVHAECMNWQMKAGMALVHRLLPSLASLEKSLDLTLQSQMSLGVFSSGNLPGMRPVNLELPRMAAAESFAGRVERYRRRAHRTVTPWLTGTVIDTVTRIKARAKRAQRAAFVSNARAKYLDQLPESLRTKARILGKGYGVVFLPGMYNHPPDPAWMNLLSAAFEHGGAVISTAAGRSGMEAHELYTMLGENSRVLQPHWEMEVPIVIHRMALALRDPGILGEAEKLVIVGHSKGGLLAHALQVLQQAYGENAGSFPSRFRDLYPGLDRLDPGEVREVMIVLKRSKFVLLGSPVEGIDYNVLVELVDHLLLEGSAEGFDQQRLFTYFESLGVGPETADLIVHSRMPSLLRSLIQISHPGNTLDTVAYRATGLFFYGISFVMGARQGDALVKSYRRYRAQFLRRRYNHIDMIVDPSAAKDLLQLIFEHLEGNQE